MTELNREMIETLVRQIVTEKLMPTKQVDPSGIMSIKLPEIDVTEDDRLDTGNPADIVYTKDLFSLRKPAPWLRFNGDERYHLRLDTRIR